ncbi:MAG: GFA family protein [Burkholderiaceae bacterium]
MHKGSCLCRQIQYELTAEPGDFGYCHCVSCRKASGSAHAANAPISRANFHQLSGAEALREFESSPGMFRAFCSNCGSPIYAYRAENPDYLGIRLGSLDTPFAKQPLGHKFTAEKAMWEPIDDDLPQFPGKALFQRPQQEGDA